MSSPEAAVVAMRDAWRVARDDCCRASGQGTGQCTNLLKVGAPRPRRAAVRQHRRHQIRTLPGAGLCCV